MPQPTRARPKSNSSRFCLTTHGHSTAFAYRSGVKAARGGRRRKAFEEAQVHWADSHGLEPGDGAYFVEFTDGAESLRQIGDGLAICGESRETVTSTIARLIDLGMIEAIPKAQRKTHMPTVAMAELELATAEVALTVASEPATGRQLADRCVVVSQPLRRALSRVFDARRYLVSISRER